MRSLGYFSSIGTSEHAARVPTISTAATARAQRNQKAVRLADGLEITGFSSNRPLGWARGNRSRAALSGRNKQNSCCGSSLAAALRQAGAAGTPAGSHLSWQVGGFAVSSDRADGSGRGVFPAIFGTGQRPMGKIIWLASYPKSGNTWLRAFVHNFLRNPDESYDLNRLSDYSLGDSAGHQY